MTTTQINLSDFVNKEVTGVFDNGNCFKGVVTEVGLSSGLIGYQITGIRWVNGGKQSFARVFCKDGSTSPPYYYWKENFRRVVKIKAVCSNEATTTRSYSSQPGINLWTLLEGGGKRVGVTYRSGETEVGFANLHDPDSAYAFMVCGRRYTFDGRFWNTESPLDIVKIDLGSRKLVLKEIERLEEELKRKRRILELCSSVSVKDVNVGEELDDGSILLKKCDGMALLVAPDCTEFQSKWEARNGVFEKIEDELGLKGDDWFFPSVKQLQLASEVLPDRFSGKVYWSSEEVDDTYVRVNGGSKALKSGKYYVRLFRCVLY